MVQNNKVIIQVSEDFETLIYQKVLELVREGKDEGEVDSELLGQLRVFIDRKPDLVMLAYKGADICPELQGKNIYVGGNY